MSVLYKDGSGNVEVIAGEHYEPTPAKIDYNNPIIELDMATTRIALGSGERKLVYQCPAYKRVRVYVMKGSIGWSSTSNYALSAVNFYSTSTGTTSIGQMHTACPYPGTQNSIFFDLSSGQTLYVAEAGYSDSAIFPIYVYYSVQEMK